MKSRTIEGCRQSAIWLTAIAVTVAVMAHASPVAVVIGADSPELERLAATELCRYLQELYGIDAAPSVGLAPDADTVFVVGRPETNPVAARLVAAARLPNLSDQGILLRPVDVDGTAGLLVTAGSPRAVLWAVYELVERWGVRYLVHGDVLPDAPGELRLPESEIHLEPNLRTRCWRLVNDLAMGPVSWGLDENRRFLRQIAKMKYNRVFISLWPAQPFVHYTFQGMTKPPGVLFFGERYPIDDDTVGKERFHGMTEFTNPAFVGATSPEEVMERGIRLCREILREAKALGMETGLAIQPFAWPKEFMAVLPGSEPEHQLGSLTAGPGQEQSMDDSLLRDMVATVFRVYVETYPDAEYIHVGMPEHRGWTGQAEQAYNALDAKYGLQDLDAFDALCARARARTSFPGGGGRVETMLKGDLAALAFFDSLVAERELLARPGGRADVKLVYNGVVAELFPLLAKMTPAGGEVLSFIDYTASRQLRQRDLLRQPPPAGLPANLIFTLADDNVGVLPQLATPSLHELMQELRVNGWSGFYTRYWTVGDLDPTVHYLARASWDPALTPQAAYKDLVRAACGPASVAPALDAWRIIETITKGLDEHGLGFGFPVKGMMTKHYNSGGLSAPLKADHASYRKALDRMCQARDKALPSGRRLLDYHVGRLTFAVRYLDAAEAFGAAATAEKAGKVEDARQHIEQAYQAIRDALSAWAEVARDHGDLGAVALMNKYCYHPIREKGG